MEAMQNEMGFEAENGKVIDLLDRHLATAIDLQLQIKQLLWNAGNPEVTEIWWLINAANEFETFCDLIAARLRSLGGTIAQGTIGNAQSRSFIDPAPPPVAGDRECFAAIIRSLTKLRDHASQARANAVTHCDEATAQLFAKLAISVDTQLWFLGSPKL